VEEVPVRVAVDRAVADRTRRAYETGWNSFVATSRSMGWRLRDAGDITYERLLEWQLTLKEVGKQDWTCRTYLMALKGFTRWLNANGHLVTDPGARFRTPRLKRTIPILPAFHDFATQLASEPSLRNRAILAIALYGGLRAAEIAGLRCANFVPDQGLIGFVGKGQKQRSVALPPQALEIVRNYLASTATGNTNGSRNGRATHADAPLLRKEDGSGDGLSYLVINRVVTRWTRRHLGVRLTPHKLRHATASTASTPASTSASSPRRSATSRSNRPRSTPRSRSSAPAASPSYSPSRGAK
jgi:integrase/recombinase XerC